MKTIALFLLGATGALSMTGCQHDEYVYHDTTRHVYTTHEEAPSAVVGRPTHLGEPGAPESFRAQSSPQ